MQKISIFFSLKFLSEPSENFPKNHTPILLLENSIIERKKNFLKINSTLNHTEENITRET
jgi:hypothetical protein